MTKFCSACKRHLPLDAFAKGHTKDGRYTYCRDCAKVRNTKYKEMRDA